MIRVASDHSLNGKAEPWHERFLQMMPRIKRQASIAFRRLPPESRDDLVEEVIAHAVIAFKALHDKNAVDLAYPSVLARYGIRRVKIGRKAAGQLNVRDVSSTYCQRAKGVKIERLDMFDRDSGWQEILIEDHCAGPAQTAIARLDFKDWLQKACTSRP